MESSWRSRGRFEANGYSFCAYVFATHAPTKPPGRAGADPATWEPGRKLERVEARLCQLPPIVRLIDPTQSHTAAFERCLRPYARACKAIGTLFCGEGWFIGIQADSDEEAQRKRAALPRSLEDAPGRLEKLFMQLEHHAVGTRLWFSTIHRDPDRLGPWERGADIASPIGRFYDLAGLGLHN